MFRADNRLLPYGLLTILGVAVYAGALWLPPTNDDDLRYLSSVATIGNPLAYFVQDHGHGNGLYRPLTPVSMWLVYQVFGIWAFPNQIINLVLHMANVFLLYAIVQRRQPDKSVALLFAAVFMISKYTWSAATLVSDRPMVLTGLFLLLLINHLSQHDEPAGDGSVAPVRVLSVAAFSVLALMSKESGLVVPTVGLLFALMLGGAHLTPRHRLSLLVVTTSIIGLYIVFRILIFGSDFASYSQDGYMFLGLVQYEDSNDLPQLLQYLNYVENLAKNALAPVLPLFDGGGTLLSWQSLLSYLPIIASTALLFGLTVRRHLSRLQWIALTIILANAVVHYALFRVRLHYLSHAAFCIFVASSPLLRDSQGRIGQRVPAQTLAVIVLAGSTLWASYMLNVYTLDRNRALDTLRTERVGRHGHIVEQVLLRYGGL